VHDANSLLDTVGDVTAALETISAGKLLSVESVFLIVWDVPPVPISDILAVFNTIDVPATAAVMLGFIFISHILIILPEPIPLKSRRWFLLAAAVLFTIAVTYVLKPAISEMGIFIVFAPMMVWIAGVLGPVPSCGSCNVVSTIRHIH